MKELIRNNKDDVRLGVKICCLYIKIEHILDTLGTEN